MTVSGAWTAWAARSMAAMAASCWCAITPGAPAFSTPAFSRCDPGQVSAQELRMVVVDRGDHAQQRPFDHIGGVQHPTQPDLDDGQVGRRLGHGQEGGGCGALEHRRLAARLGHRGLDPVQHGVQRIVLDQPTRQPDPLVEPHQMGRGVGVHPQPRRLGDGPDHRDRGPLAVRPRHMDHRRQSMLRIAQRRAQGLHPIQRQIDPLRMSRAQPLGNRVQGRQAA